MKGQDIFAENLKTPQIPNLWKNTLNLLLLNIILQCWQNLQKICRMNIDNLLTVLENGRGTENSGDHTDLIFTRRKQVTWLDV